MRLFPIFLALSLISAPTAAPAQWTLQDAHTTADLRGIDSLSNGVAWASGTNGTVLRTEDMGQTWQHCTTPPNADHLDFRGIQAFDKDTAIVMSSGKGDLSRLYKTTDGCQTWTLAFTNPDKDGFWDALLFLDPQHGIVFGDPVSGTPGQSAGEFRIRVTADGGKTWGPVSAPEHFPPQNKPDRPGDGLHALPTESAFAASNSAVAALGNRLWFATSAGRVSRRELYPGPTKPPHLFLSTFCFGAVDRISGECWQPWRDFEDALAPVNHQSASAGIFALHFRSLNVGVAVGGDYLKPLQQSGTAARSSDGGLQWTAASTPPHGYRSAVAYDPTHNLWITVGPNGTDISADDGRNWRPLKPSPQDPPDADQHWNALSLPFVVGPHGRIGTLRPDALPTSEPPKPQSHP